jgi:hypothetical protein
MQRTMQRERMLSGALNGSRFDVEDDEDVNIRYVDLDSDVPDEV